MIKTLFYENIIPKERIEYIFIPCISVDSALKIDNKNYQQVYLEQYKYKVKKREIKSFIDYEIDLDSHFSLTCKIFKAIDLLFISKVLQFCSSGGKLTFSQLRLLIKGLIFEILSGLFLISLWYK